MKRCPQCNTVYGEDIQFCLNDGRLLVEENTSPTLEASDLESETVVPRDKFVVDLTEETVAVEPIIVDLTEETVVRRPAADKPFDHQTPPAETIIIKKPVKSKNPAFFLVLGLLLGGSLVLAALILARNFYQNDTGNATETNQSSETNSGQNVGISSSKIPLDIEKLSQKHEVRTSADNAKFNGHVIALNAYVRAAPDKNSKEIDVLPIDDRINIERRENENSPWFYVTCEHGTNGWMHGNTIEFRQ